MSDRWFLVFYDLKETLLYFFIFADLEVTRARQREIEEELARLHLNSADKEEKLRTAEGIALALDTEYEEGLESLKMSVMDAMRLGVTQIIQRFRLPFQVGAQFFEDRSADQYLVFLPTDTPIPGLELDFGQCIDF